MPLTILEENAAALATEHTASSADDVARLDAAMQPGDELVLADGIWGGERLIIAADGTAELPITIRAQTPGNAVFTGDCSITLAGDHLVLKGIRFKDFTGERISTIAVTGSHCRVTECAMENGTSRFYVHLIGAHNRLDHSYLAEKTSDNPTVQVEASAERPNRTRIDANHFGHRPPLGRNGGETIRLGYSHQAHNVLGAICEGNLFDHCDGELEIISNKSSENVYRGNTFRECAGTLTLRHGDRCVVDGNFFLGRRKLATGGIRVLGEGHVITNNYLDGLVSGAILITTGAVDPRPQDHAQARNCVIAHNTIVDSVGPYLMLSAGLGNSPRRSVKPANITLANNVYSVPAGAELLRGPEGKDYHWFGNFAETAPGGDKVKHPAIKPVQLLLVKGEDGVWRPGPNSPVRGAAVDVLDDERQVQSDIDGQPRRNPPADAGCDEQSDQPIVNRPLSSRDVGPSWRQPATEDERLQDRLARSEWVGIDESNGKLTYKSLDTGDRVMDFSAAGYRGGGVALPHVNVARTVHSPGIGGEDEEKDYSREIQEAIDAVSALPLVDGVRGAVLLEAGTYRCSRPLTIRASGVVLRGSGAHEEGTTLELTGRPHVCIRVRGPDDARRDEDDANNEQNDDAGIAITDVYVPSGADAVSVADASSLKPGDDVIVRRPVTAEWVRFMGMDDLTRNGQRQLWVREDAILSRRKIKSVQANRVVLDVPLSDSLNSKLLDPPGASVIKAAAARQISEVGIEALRIHAPAAIVSINQPLFRAIEMDAVHDAWVRDVAVAETVNSIRFGENTARLTAERVSVTHRVSTVGAAKPADFTVSGTQVLLHQCESVGDNLFHFVTGARTNGPNVLLNCNFGGKGWVQPHQRWATGLLVDNCRAPEGGIDFMNRGSMGSGHGWTIGWAVAWNCSAKSLLIQQPPGAVNWAVGCTGALTDRPQPFGKIGIDPNVPRGTIDSHGTPVRPRSLYLAQLRERLGSQALQAIGYTDEDAK